MYEGHATPGVLKCGGVQRLPCDVSDWQVQLPDTLHWFPDQGHQSHYYQNVQVNIPHILTVNQKQMCVSEKKEKLAPHFKNVKDTK